MSNPRYTTFGRDMSSGGGSQSGYGYPNTAQDRVTENLKNAEFLLNDGGQSNTMMDGYNIGFQQPSNMYQQRPGTTSNMGGIGLRSQYSASVSDFGADDYNRNVGGTGARSPSIGAGNEGIGTLDVPSRRGGRVAGNSSNQNTSFNQQQRPMTGGGASFQRNNFEDEFGRNDHLARGVSQNLLSQAGSQFGDDDDLSHGVLNSEYGGYSNINDPDQKPATAGSRRQQVLARQGITDTKSNQGANDRRPPTSSKPKPQDYGLFLGGGSDDPKMARNRSEGPSRHAATANTIDSNENKNSQDGGRNRSTAIFLGGDQTSQKSAPMTEPPNLGQVRARGNGNQVDILENKTGYINSKKREEIEDLKTSLRQEKERH